VRNTIGQKEDGRMMLRSFKLSEMGPMHLVCVVLVGEYGIIQH
jgi:hypothetical protein